jgi:hypothetical protein
MTTGTQWFWAEPDLVKSGSMRNLISTGTMGISGTNAVRIYDWLIPESVRLGFDEGGASNDIADEMSLPVDIGFSMGLTGWAGTMTTLQIPIVPNRTTTWYGETAWTLRPIWHAAILVWLGYRFMCGVAKDLGSV